MKKWAAWLMAASMAAGSMGVTAYGSVFTDIGSVPWPGAATFIDQAASMGLMNGYNENGKKYCKPRNNVSYCEAVQLMYSIMKAHSKQDVSDTVVTKWKPVMSAYNIPSWAYNAVAYGLENNILATEELGKMRNGTGNANREDVGRIFGKALSTLDGYTLVSNPSLSYRDAMQVSSDAKPYLELLNRSKLMVGDTNNNFNPKSNINRSEMAVLSVKTYNTLTQNGSGSTQTPSTGAVVGTVVKSMVLSNGDLFLSLQTNTGAVRSLFGTKGSLTPTYENKSISFTDIGTGDVVTAAYSGDQLKSLVVTTSKAGINKEVTYELVKITSSRATIKDGSKEKYYDIDRNADIRLDGSRSTTSKISDALKNAKYNVTLTLDKDEYVTKLDAVKSSNNPTKGLLTKLTNTEITIKSGNKSYDFTLHDGDISVKKDNKSVMFKKLKNDYKSNNYTVSVKLNNKGHVTDIVIESEEDETHGDLYDLTSRKIWIKANGETFWYPIDEDDVDVFIDGKSKNLDTLRDSFNQDKKGYTIALEVDRDGVATEIYATSKNAENSKGTLKYIDSDEITITIDNKDYDYDLDSDVDVMIDSKRGSLSDLKKYYRDYTYEVELEFNSRGDVSKIEATLGEIEDGILRDINDRNSEITIEAGGVKYDLEYTSSVKVTLEGDSITLDKLNDKLDWGDDIFVKLSYSSGRVSKITATWENESGDTVKGVIYSIDSDNDEIRIEKNNGKSTYTLASDVEVKLDGSKSSLYKLENAFDDLDNDEEIRVTLTLNSRERVTKIVAEIEDADDVNDSKPKAGYLRSVKTSGDGKITITESTSNSAKEYTWNLDSDTEIRFNIDDRNTYDADYKETIYGLRNFMEDCAGNNDDCYVELKTNSDGDVTRITAKDK